MIKKIITTAFSLGCLMLYSQSDKSLRLYANLGSQMSQTKSAFNTDLNDSNFTSLQVGAGSNYKIGQFIIGTEFYNSKGDLKNNNNKIKYQEFTTTLYLGYDFLKSPNFALETNLGITLSSKQSILHDLLNQTSSTFQIEQIGISPSLTFIKFNKTGTFIGLKAGFNYALNNHNWNNGLDNSKTGYDLNRCSPFIQLNIGGRIKLPKKTK